jgi:hypothetical protein
MVYSIFTVFLANTAEFKTVRALYEFKSSLLIIVSKWVVSAAPSGACSLDEAKNAKIID